jgi:hypothetical protein
MTGDNHSSSSFAFEEDALRPCAGVERLLEDPWLALLSETADGRGFACGAVFFSRCFL